MLQKTGILLMLSVLTIAGSSCDELVTTDYTAPGIYHISTKQGSDFSFTLPQHKITGYELCWINESQLPSFQLKKNTSRIVDANDISGAGEKISYTFLVNKKGIDTIKISNCPTSLWQKEAKFFEGDSVRKMIDGKIVSEYEPNRKADFMIVVDAE